ncbi:isoaspartyl peptidase/L-asparaginase [Rhodocaloribacter litoris]|uniref:isoaspartyl peptidase/L-asparaginase n=1 Tax=Rhodocaloribacter litoris TaxID=2558931 RepID=UPI001423B314|nr:isoaspartyl peptidase/L-asparaginase [Rhodocaloribacter litoris]QXD15891.1 isoaspartyl peptidase/L-asparaginase [Rhodocaloribacter litoris]
MTLKSGIQPVPGGAGACLMVHGGAWDIPGDVHADHLDGMRQALRLGRRLLREGAPARRVVAEVVAVMESHGAFDAGRGAVLTLEGTVELDAGLMDGATLDYGGVLGVRRIENPVRVAHRLLEASDGRMRLLACEGAERFAAAQGFPLVENEALICARERARYEQLRREAVRYHTSHPFLPPQDRAPQGTVGCVARDRQGRLAAATSTGGTPFRPSGRVGDTPLPGAGYYATAQAAASATGWGEAIAAVLLCARAVDRVAEGLGLEAVVSDRLRHMHTRIRNPEGRGATGGLLLLDAHGRGAWAFTTPRMARGGWYEGGEIWVEV